MQKQRNRSNPKSGNKKPANLKLTTDSRGRVVYASQDLLKITGLTRKALTETSLKDLIHTATAKKVLQLLEKGSAGTRVILEVGLKGASKKHPVQFQLKTDKKQVLVPDPSKEFQEVIQNATEIIYKIDATGKLLFVSPEFERSFGFPIKDFSNLHFEAVVHPDDWSICYEAIARAIDSRRPVRNVIYRVRSADNEWHWLRTSLSFLFKEDGSPLYAIGMSLDITDLREALKRAESAEQRYSVFLQNSSEAIYRIETPEGISVLAPFEEMLAYFREEGYLAECNEAYVKLNGAANAEELIGKPIALLRNGNAGISIDLLRQFRDNGFRLNGLETVEVNASGEIMVLMNNLVGIVEEGKLIRVWGTQHDVTELKRTQDQLKRSEKRYKDFIHQSTEIIWRGDLEQPININDPLEEQVDQFFQHAYLAECNERMAELYGFKNSAQLIGARLKDFVSMNNNFTPDTAVKFVQNGYKLLRAPSVQYDTKGNKKYFLNDLFAIIKDGFVTRIWGVQTDVTEQRLAQKALIQSEERYRAFIQQSTEGIWRIENISGKISIQIPEDELIDSFYKYGRLTECNDAFARMYGYENSSEMIGMDLETLLPSTDPFNIEYLKQFIRSGFRLENVESHELDKWGNRIFISNSLIGVIENGKLERVWGMQRDITQIKKAELEIRNREEQYRNLSENVQALIFRFDRNYRITYINHAAKHTFNQPPEIFNGRTPLEVGIAPSVWQMLQEKGERVFNEGSKESFTFRIPSNSSPGKNYNLLMTLSPEYDSEGAIFSIIAVANEFTPIIEAQEKIEYKDKLLSIISGLSAELLQGNDYDESIQKAIRELGTAMGAERAFVLENKFEKDRPIAYLKYKWLNPNIEKEQRELSINEVDFGDRQEIYNSLNRNEPLIFDVDEMKTQSFKNSIQQQHIKSVITYPVLLKNELWGVIGFMSLKDKSVWGEVEQDILKAYTAVLSNAIQRRLSEIRIQESETRFRQLADHAPVMIWVSDKNNHTTYLNKYCTDFIGMDLDAVNETGWEELIHPDERDAAAASYQSHFERMEPVLIEYRLRKHTGEYRWVLDQSTPRFLSDGTFEGYIGSLIDIHDRKTIEEKMRFQARVMQEISDAVIAVDLNYQVVAWNKGAEKIFQVAAADAVGKQMSEVVNMQFISDSREAAKEHVNKYGIWSGDVFVEQEDGRKLFLHSSVSFLNDENGNRVGLVGINRDITYRKKAEDELRNSEERYRSLVNALGEGIILYNSEGKILMANKSAEMILRLNMDAMKGKDNSNPEWKVFDEQGVPKQLSEHPHVVSLREGRSVRNTILGLRHGDAPVIWTSINTEPIYYSENREKPDAVVATVVDITQRKTSESELQHNAEQLRQFSERMNIILNSITDGFIAIDNNRKVLLWNKVFEDSTGIAQEKAIGRDLLELVPGLSLSIPDIVNEPASIQQSYSREYWSNLWKMWVEMSVFPSSQGLFLFFRDITKRKRQELHLRLEKEVLEMNAGAQGNLKGTADFYLKGLETIFPGIYCSLILYNEDSQTLDPLSGPSIPEEYTEQIRGLKSGPQAGSCGTALYTGKNVIVTDIETDPLWADYRVLAKQFGFCSCWSYIIKGAENHSLASFAIYTKKPMYPSQEQIETLERAVNILRVILENKQSEEKIKISNERYLLATMATNDAIWDTDLNTRSIYWGEGFHSLFGYKAGYYNEADQIWENNIHPQDRDRVLKSMETFINSHSQQVWQEEYRFRKTDGKYVLVSDRGFLIYNQLGKVSRMVGSMQDVTEKRELEKKVLKQEINKQKLVAQAVVEAQEKERSLIGKELHDNVNQILSTTKLYLEVAHSDENDRLNLIRMGMNNISDAINEIRTISRSLVPASIGDLGLVESVHDLVESIKITRTFNVDFQHSGEIDNKLNEQQKLMLFRIVQEQVNNVIKHSAAHNLMIELHEDNNEIRMSIADDGKGFDPDQVKLKKGLGLTNIMSRAELFNGKVDIKAAPGKGCCLTVSIPILNL